MPKESFPMTKEGLEKIKEELVDLESNKRESNQRRIKKARSFCDFQEDSEYELALKEQAHTEERISHLKHMIQQAEIIKNKDYSFVGLGSTVTFKDSLTHEIEKYTIVGSEEADPLRGKISYQSQVAQSLLGTKENDVVTVITPSGERQIVVVRIS